jgi:hypothetical protein
MRFRVEEVRDQVRPASPAEQEEAREAVRALARPRLTGTEGAREVEAELRRRFEALGYEVREQPFSFSAWPGRFGVSAVGAVLAVAGLTATLLLAGGFAAAGLLAVALALGVVLVAVAGARWAILSLPWGRVETSNWLVQRPSARPRYLAMAHRDSKSQFISLFVRGAAIAVAALAWAVLLLVAVAALAFAPPVPLAAVLVPGIAATLASATLVFCWADNQSPGALDNATGLAALLGVAARERESDDVAFLITDAEELGLAGSLVAGGVLAPVFGIINLDGLDDEGDFHLIERHGWPRRRGLAPHLVAALLTAADALAEPLRRRALPTGVLVDHIPLVEAGFSAVTLMRGRRSSLMRVHRAGDDAQGIDGRGAAATAALVHGAFNLLRLPEPPIQPVLSDTLGAGIR